MVVGAVGGDQSAVGVGGISVPGRTLVFGLEVDQHVGVAQARLDRVLEQVGDRVGVLQRGARPELHVQVDVALRAGAAGAQVVEAGHSARAERAHRLGDRLQLRGGQGLVHQHAGRALQDPHSGQHDRARHHQRHRRVDPARAGHLDSHQADQHAGRRERVGAQVGGVALQRRRLGRRSAPGDEGSHRQVGHHREGDHADAQSQHVHIRAPDQPAHGLEHDHAGADQDQHSLDRRRPRSPPSRARSDGRRQPEPGPCARRRRPRSTRSGRSRSAGPR